MFGAVSIDRLQNDDKIPKIPMLTIANHKTDTKQTIAINNWPSQFPYSPKVAFNIHHDGDNLYIKFDVEEKYTKAEITEDNGAVWTDSCVEFFISFDDRGYYNFEVSCIGKMLLAFRKEKPSPTYAMQDIMTMVKRVSSLGNTTFAEKTGDNKWTLEVTIPKEAFFQHTFTTLNGIEATANFYKCGDDLTEPHFLSWNPISAPSPNFHLPACFGAIKFQ